jgi:signal transduction histidine kinase
VAKIALSARLIRLADSLSTAAQRLSQGILRHLWCIPPWRTGLEAALLAAALLAVVLPPMKVAPDVVISATFLLFSLLGGSWAGLRLPLPSGRWKSTFGREFLFALPLALLIALAFFAVLSIDGIAWLFERPAEYLVPILPAIGMAIPAFLIVRGASCAWRWWDEQRRRRFQWAFTHAQLTVVALLGLLLLLVGLGVIGYTVHAELQSIPSLPGSPPYSVFMQVIVWLLGLAFLTLLFVGLGGLLVLPAALLFSYLVARGLSQRVETLAQAAQCLQAGDFSARVAVSGQDELAQLQEAFNRMAADLQTRTQELQVEHDRTAALLRAQRELTASVSHELRTPVATARTYLDSLLDRPAGPQSEERHDLQILSAEVDRLESLIDDLFTLSRAEVDRLSLSLAPVHLVPLLNGLVETAGKPAWDLRRVQVMLSACPECLYVQADAVRLEQMVRNLLQNSLRHTQPGGCVQVSAGNAAGRVRIQVEDSGEGIAPDDLPHIWERFYRGEGARLAGEGSGLGLALVKELAEAMGGAVGVESTLGEGSRFWIELPGASPAT